MECIVRIAQPMLGSGLSCEQCCTVDPVWSWHCSTTNSMSLSRFTCLIKKRGKSDKITSCIGALLKWMTLRICTVTVIYVHVCESRYLGRSPHSQRTWAPQRNGLRYGAGLQHMDHHPVTEEGGDNWMAASAVGLLNTYSHYKIYHYTFLMSQMVKKAFIGLGTDTYLAWRIIFGC